MLEPTRAAGLARLAEFAPRMGHHYAAGRNSDPGPGARRDVSELSAHVRHRLITEEEMVRAALAQHSPQAAEKFIQEVYWRSYWKGFLELRPQMWRDYRARADAMPVTQAAQAAMEGRSGIDCFDAWARELAETGYLHNHVRMWVASIWIFTLRLPWVLGAEWFLRHLHDADAASNTLSWRWVAGIQTPGKHYLARAENIARHSFGRFDPRGQLNETAEPLNEPGPPPAGLLPPAATPRGRVALLLHEDDVTFWPEGCDVVAVGMLPSTRPFARAALEDGARLAAARTARAPEAVAPADAARWAAGLDAQLVMPWAPVGWCADATAEIPALRARRAWDEACWPLARRGFFPFKENIPKLLRSLHPPAALAL